MKHTPQAAARRHFPLVAAVCTLALASPARADDAAAPLPTVEISTHKTRSSVALNKSEIQKILPGTNPLKALETLPGVSFQSADPWGNNEQNLSLFVHGFSGQQLGYTMDGVPLGDQQYGNYNGLSPQRAVISENVGRVLLSSGAGDLGTASTSNLGGTIDTFSSDPLTIRNTNLQQTVGSHAATRTFLRYDSGLFGDGNTAYLSALHQMARAWDFNGKQGGDQVNAKLVHRSDAGKLTLFFDYSDKTEPNEDSTVHVAGETAASTPTTRPFLYPDFNAALKYLSPTGATPAADGSNYRNYYSDAQRRDYLGYAKFEADLSGTLRWSNQLYIHHDDGVGVVAGPIGVAGLPALFGIYYPQQDLKQVFGGTGYALRTTEYTVKRGGLLSSLRKEIGEHQIELGAWFEHNRSSAYRRWYGMDAASSPYARPSNPLITQYGSEIDNKVFQLHLQDEWKPRPDLAVQAGFKSSLQFADGTFPVQPAKGAIAGGSLALPQGEIITKKWFLPQIGARWDVTPQDQLYANIQKNLRQFITYGGGGASPWSLASQGAFDLFKADAKPESALTYEAGWRANHRLQLGALSAVDGQINVYHVDFSNRLLQISPTPVILAIIGGNPVLANVGAVRTDGVDLAGTLHFGRDFSFYNALSYNRSRYADNYTNGALVVQTAGKTVPGAPAWMNKFVATANLGAVEYQLIGDYVGKRYATYTNDLSEAATFLMSLGASGPLPAAGAWLKKPRWRVNVSNLANRAGTSNVVVAAADKTYNTFPIAPRQVFLTVMADF